MEIIDQRLPEINRSFYCKNKLILVDKFGLQVLAEFKPQLVMKASGIMSETKSFANGISTAVNNERLMFVFGWVNADNKLVFDPFTFLVELVLIYLMLLSFFSIKGFAYKIQNVNDL